MNVVESICEVRAAVAAARGAGVNPVASDDAGDEGVLKGVRRWLRNFFE